MKKKIVSVLLASLMVTSMLAGCGNSSGSSSSSGTGGDTTSASGTEAGDTGLTAEEQEAVYNMRKALNGLKSEDAVEQILNMFARTRNNAEFVQMAKKQKFI
mgnify:CR=1 FL=1